MTTFIKLEEKYKQLISKSYLELAKNYSSNNDIELSKIRDSKAKYVEVDSNNHRVIKCFQLLSDLEDYISSIEEKVIVPLKAARIKANLTQQNMSDLLEIPKRTIESWESSSESGRQCPRWAEKLIIEKLESL